MDKIGRWDGKKAKAGRKGMDHGFIFDKDRHLREKCRRIDTKANREHDRPTVGRKGGKRGTRTSGGGQMRLLARCSESVHNTAALTAPWIAERVLPPPAI